MDLAAKLDKLLCSNDAKILHGSFPWSEPLQPALPNQSVVQTVLKSRGFSPYRFICCHTLVLDMPNNRAASD